MSLRGLHRTFGVCYQAVMKWPGEERKSRATSRLRGHAAARPAQKGDVLELDELWSFVGGKSHAALWLWVAPLVEEPARAWLGPSVTAACKVRAILRADLPPGHRRGATRGDYWDACAGTFPRGTHRYCGKEAGETCHVERWFGTLRARPSRLVRRAYFFPRSAEDHLGALHFLRHPLIPPPCGSNRLQHSG